LGFIKINEPQRTLKLWLCFAVVTAFIAPLFDTKADKDCEDRDLAELLIES